MQSSDLSTRSSSTSVTAGSSQHNMQQKITPTTLPPISHILAMASPQQNQQHHQYQPQAQPQPQPQPYNFTFFPPQQSQHLFHYNNYTAAAAPPPITRTLSYAPYNQDQMLFQHQLLSSPTTTTTKRTRNNLPKEVTYVLLRWLRDHVNHPYPSACEKNQLMMATGLNQQQLSNWFINARRRKLKALKHL